MWSGGQWWFSEDGRFSGVSIPFFIDLKIFHNKYFLSEQKHPHPHTERHSIAGDVRGVKEVTLGDPRSPCHLLEGCRMMLSAITVPGTARGLNFSWVSMGSPSSSPSGAVVPRKRGWLPCVAVYRL